MQEITQTDINALYQSHKNIQVRLDLYEYAPDVNGVFSFRKVDEISGVVVDGSMQEDANSEVRRTADLDIQVQNSSFVIDEASKVWLDKYVSLYIGYESEQTKEMLWYHLGIMEMMAPSYSYDATTQDLKLDLSDMVVSLDGTKNGAIIGAAVKFEKDEESIKHAMEATIAELGNWHNYLVDDIGEYGYENVTDKNRIPHTIEMKVGATVYEVIKELRDLYPGYESYFEKDGTFRVKRIPSCMNDPVMMTHEELLPLIISEQNNTIALDKVRNVTEIYGKSYEMKSSSSSSSSSSGTGGSGSSSSSSSGSSSSSSSSSGSSGNDIDYFTEIVSGTGGNYECIFEEFTDTAFTDNTVFSFIPSHNNPGSVTLKVNDLEAVPVIMSVPNTGDKEIPANFIEEGMPIVVRYEADEKFNRRFVYLGRTQIRGVYILVSKARDWNEMLHDILKYNTQNIEYGVNPDSPLTVDKIGERRQVLSGNDYQKIESEVEALERAQYETWLSTNMAQTLTLETILIPWLEVNQKIGYESPLAEMERQELGLPIDHEYDTQYIIKRIERSFSEGTQTMQLTRFYDLYPFIISSTRIHV